MSKINIVIGSLPKGDWGMDLLWAGLVQNLGPENVVDFPILDKHRVGLPKYTGNLEKDWGAERGSFCYTGKEAQAPSWDIQTLRRMLEAGMVERIWVDERDQAWNLYQTLGAQHFKVPVVVVAGHDKFWNRDPFFLSKMYGDKLQAMFLDNWRPEYEQIPQAHIYNWSANFDHLWKPPGRDKEIVKKYDICFMGSADINPDRAKYIDHIRQRWGHLNNFIIFERNTINGFLLKQQYFDVLSQSKICLNLRGDAENGKAMRFWEIPFSASFMLSQRTGGNELHPFEGGKHCAYFSDIADMDSQIAWYLENEEFRENVAFEGWFHLQLFHSTRIRIQEMLEVLDGQS